MVFCFDLLPLRFLDNTSITRMVLSVQLLLIIKPFLLTGYVTRILGQPACSSRASQMPAAIPMACPVRQAGSCIHVEVSSNVKNRIAQTCSLDNRNCGCGTRLNILTHKESMIRFCIY